jgi:translation initiation factor eIF-2B subunit epsilon
MQFEEKRECSSADSKALQLDIAFWSGRDSVTIRTDLLDTGIYICSPEVPMLFSDNFDYQNVRKDFVSGVLSEEELGNKLYIHEVQNKYATRIRSFRSYGAVSKDILSRWTYPLVPESNLFRSGNEMDDVSWLTQQRWGPKESQYRYSKGRVYMYVWYLHIHAFAMIICGRF